MKVSELISGLNKIENKDANILIASDQEWNTLYSDIGFEVDSETKDYVLFGKDGSQRF